MKKSGIVILIVAMLGLSLLFLNWSGMLKFYPSWVSSPNFPHLKSLYLNRQGNGLFKLESYGAAFDSYVKTLEFDPFSAETHLDLGLVYEAQQQPEKAMTSYQNAEKYTKDDEVKFMGYFNQAQLFGKGKKVDEALAFYQKALELDPTSKEAKTNIELLIQQQQQQGKGGDSQDQKDQKDQQQQQDQQKKQDPKDGKDPKDQQQKQDQKDGQDGKDKKEQPKQYQQNQKQQPRQFKGQELSEGDVKKILGEIKQQEQKIRSEYNRKEVKEQGRDKDW
ncbi:tetratricopeptide repeat protein [Bdellovibrio sp. HCB337]|uniref:tetratricopeptide repeat protein n=1 Tax=Bdellovibrio sp. HCB337 TaxID=3394358 RepID=UPI0039A4F327